MAETAVCILVAAGEHPAGERGEDGEHGDHHSEPQVGLFLWPGQGWPCKL
jgi:hypothetical protein